MFLAFKNINSYFYVVFNWNFIRFFFDLRFFFLKNRYYLLHIIITINFLEEYFNFFIYIIVCFLFSKLLLNLSYYLGGFLILNFYNEKNTPYECGFEAFSDAKSQFNVMFYIVALLFVIFDVEIIYFLPWAVNFYDLNSFSNFIFFFFNSFLIIAFTYEYIAGVFNWSIKNIRYLNFSFLTFFYKKK